MISTTCIHILFIFTIIAMFVHTIIGLFLIFLRITPEGYVVLAVGVVWGIVNGIASRAIVTRAKAQETTDPTFSDIRTVSPL